MIVKRLVMALAIVGFIMLSGCSLVSGRQSGDVHYLGRPKETKTVVVIVGNPDGTFSFPGSAEKIAQANLDAALEKRFPDLAVIKVVHVVTAELRPRLLRSHVIYIYLDEVNKR